MQEKQNILTKFVSFVELITIRIKMRRIRNKKKVILANDPSMTAWGWVVLSLEGEVLDQGCFKTEPAGKKARVRAGDDRIRRINEINSVFSSLLKKYDIQYMCAELPHGSQNARGAVMIGLVVGLLQTLATFCNIPIEWFSEDDAKKSIAGSRKVSKDDMVKLIEDNFDINLDDAKWKVQGIADAMAVYHVALRQSNILKFLNSKK